MSRRLPIVVACLLLLGCGTDTVELRANNPPDAGVDAGVDAAVDAAPPSACVCVMPCRVLADCAGIGTNQCDTDVGVCVDADPPGCDTEQPCQALFSCVVRNDRAQICP